MHKLLIIDPQNDFLDIAGAALPVPGALADVERTAQFIRDHGRALQGITVTLDSHPELAIERPGFWVTRTGVPVVPFTVIRHSEVLDGTYAPKNLELRPRVLNYLQALELGGKCALMVWPAHCVVGTWGHAMPHLLADTLAQWEGLTGAPVYEVRKGLNPLTEQYSAVQAEVPDSDDDCTFKNYALVEAVTPASNAGGYLLVAGEALSHCVRATVSDLFDSFSRAQVAHTVLLTDCMSPVSGFEAQAEEFLHYVRSRGARTLNSVQAAALLASSSSAATAVSAPGAV